MFAGEGVKVPRLRTSHSSEDSASTHVGAEPKNVPGGTDVLGK